MIPQSVSFTGLEISHKDMALFRVHPGPIPPTWAVIEGSFGFFGMQKMVEWLLENVDGRFGIIPGYPLGFVFFESDIDAVMFRLKGGDDLFKDSTSF